jgi:hypothetical protein
MMDHGPHLTHSTPLRFGRSVGFCAGAEYVSQPLGMLLAIEPIKRSEPTARTGWETS